MTQVNIADAEKNLSVLIQLLTSGQQDKIILTQDDEVVAELISPPKKTRKDGFGAMKGKYEFPPDFDEWFVSADKEILEMFSDDPDCEF